MRTSEKVKHLRDEKRIVALFGEVGSSRGRVANFDVLLDHLRHGGHVGNSQLKRRACSAPTAMSPLFLSFCLCYALSRREKAPSLEKILRTRLLDLRPASPLTGQRDSPSFAPS